MQFEVAFWPFIQVVNFYFLPISLRLIYVHATCLVEAVVLSTFKHNVSSVCCAGEIYAS